MNDYKQVLKNADDAIEALQNILNKLDILTPNKKWLESVDNALEGGKAARKEIQDCLNAN